MARRVPLLLALVAIAVGLSADSRVGEGAVAPPQKPKPKAVGKLPGTRVPKPSKVPALASPSPTPLPTPGAAASTDAERLALIRSRRQAVEREIVQLQNQTESTLKDLDTIDLDLRLAAHRFDEAELEFKETTRLLDATIRDVQATRGRIEAARPRVQRSLAALSKLGELSYARLLFSLDDPADILRGYRFVSRMASADGEQIKGFRENLAKLSALETQLKARTAQNLETRRRLNEARGFLSLRKQTKEQRIEEIGRQRQLQEELAEEYQRRETEVLRLLGESGEVGAFGEIAQPRTSSPTDAPFHTRKGDLTWPVAGTPIRKFGVEREPRFGTRTIQQGIEIDAFPEIEVRAVLGGRVVFADQFVGYGMLVILDHGHREHTLYGRLGELLVAPGDEIKEGALLGLLPNTRVTGSGLHFEVRVQGKPEDPLDWLKKP